MLRDSVRASLAHVGQALREPEDFTLAWHRQAVDYRPEVWLALMLTAIAGTVSYGMTMGIGLGARAIAEKATLLTLAAGLAWAIPLPALYILGSLAGSRPAGKHHAIGRLGHDQLGRSSADRVGADQLVFQRGDSGSGPRTVQSPDRRAHRAGGESTGLYGSGPVDGRRLLARHHHGRAAARSPAVLVSHPDRGYRRPIVLSVWAVCLVKPFCNPPTRASLNKQKGPIAMIEITKAELTAGPSNPLPFIPCRPIGEPTIAGAVTDPPAVPVIETPPSRSWCCLPTAKSRLWSSSSCCSKTKLCSTDCCESEPRQRELLPKFMAVAVACFAIYGIVTTGVLNGFVWHGDYWLPHLPPARAGHWSMGNLTAAYTLGLIAANGICLPSFYFYGLLAGLRTTMLAIAAQAIKAMASGGLALVGLLPVYLALALTGLITPARAGIGYRADADRIDPARLRPDFVERSACTPVWADLPPRWLQPGGRSVNASCGG